MCIRDSYSRDVKMIRRETIADDVMEFSSPNREFVESR